MPPPPQNFQLPYDTVLGVGKIRAYRPDAATLVVLVGPPPLLGQLLRILPLAVFMLFLSIWLGALIWSTFIYPGMIPLDHWLLLPASFAWAFVGYELALLFRNWGGPTRFIVSAGVFHFPYPHPQSQLEEVPTESVIRMRVTSRRGRFLRSERFAIEVQVDRRTHFDLLRGYPQKTLDEVCHLLAIEVGLKPRD